MKKLLLLSILSFLFTINDACGQEKIKEEINKAADKVKGLFKKKSKDDKAGTLNTVDAPKPNVTKNYKPAGFVWLTKPEFERQYEFSEGLAFVKINDKYGFIDNTGKIVIPTTYDGVSNFYEGLAGVKIGKVWGFIDKTGKQVIEPKFEDNRYGVTPYFSESVAAFRIGNKFQFIDKQGTVVIQPLLYSYARHFSEGLSQVSIPNYKNVDKYGYTERAFIDKTGVIVIKGDYKEADNFKEGLARVQLQKNDKWGFIDGKGKMVIDAEYKMAYDFENGLACVKQEKAGLSRLGFIDKTGKIIVPIVLESIVKSFSNGYAAVTYEGKLRYIDQLGNLISEATQQNVLYDDGLLKLTVNGLVGFKDLNDNVIIEPQFQETYSKNNDDIMAVKAANGKYGFIKFTNDAAEIAKYKANIPKFTKEELAAASKTATNQNISCIEEYNNLCKKIPGYESDMNKYIKLSNEDVKQGNSSASNDENALKAIEQLIFATQRGEQLMQSCNLISDDFKKQNSKIISENVIALRKFQKEYPKLRKGPTTLEAIVLGIVAATN